MGKIVLLIAVVLILGGTVTNATGWGSDQCESNPRLCE